MESICDWLVQNIWSKCILFGTKKKCKVNDTFGIMVKDQFIEGKPSVKYLGAILERDMSGTEMGKKVIKKVHSTIKFLYMNMDFLVGM